MNCKDLTYDQINSIPSSYYLNKNNLEFNDIAFIEDLNEIQNNIDIYNNEFDREIRNKNNKRNYAINRFNFFIMNKKSNNDLEEEFSTKNKINLKQKIQIKKLGRKRKSDSSNNGKQEEEQKIHNKYSEDNIMKKCKNILQKYLLKFINGKIKEKYGNKSQNKKLKKELKIISQENTFFTNVILGKAFLNKTLKDIFSNDISNRVQNYPKTHNKELIESLLEDNDDNNKCYFNKLFNITFLDCLKHFREDQDIHIVELNGLKNISDVKGDLMIRNGKEYTDIFIHYLKNYEEIIGNKKPRKKKKKNK